MARYGDFLTLATANQVSVLFFILSNFQHQSILGQESSDSGKPLQIRLMDGPNSGPNSLSGRIEIRRNDTEEWGTVCDDEFGHQDAQVVCRMLGSTGGRAVRQSKVFGRGTGPIRLDNVNCQGTETSLSDCPSRGWDQHDCSHNEDAGVVCGAMSEIEVRLVGGFLPNQGRIEMRTKPAPGSQNSSLWGTMCNEGLNLATGDVICRMLNYTGGAVRADERLAFGPGTGPVLVDRVVCVGNETDISDCQLLTEHRRWCSNADDAGVICKVDTASPPLQLRMMDGSTTNEGRVEITKPADVAASWGTICDQGWDNDAARVACRSFGNDAYATAVGPGYFGNQAGTTPISSSSAMVHSLYAASMAANSGPSSTVVRRVVCTGRERHLSECEILAMDEASMLRCRGNDAGVVCQSSETQDFELRLVKDGQINSAEGRVEVKRRARGNWGTVCDDSWGITESELVCRLLGRPGIAVTRKGAFYGPGNGSITLDDVKCPPNATNLGQCAYRGLGFNDCQHSEDVGVLCIGANITSYQVRLTSGLQASEGRLEVRRHEMEPWGTVCDDGWNMQNAKVVCRKLGFGGNVSYTGSGTRLTLQGGQITSNNANLGFAQHIAIASLSGDRLLTPISSNMASSSASNILGSVSVGSGLVHFDTTSLDMPIHLAWVNCTGSETDLIQCGNSYNYTWGKHACSHSEDVYVSCQTNVAPSLEVRLEGGLWPWEGTVRLRNSNSGEWGTICDDDWDAKDASVICRMLGYNGTARAYTASHFGRGIGPIYLDNVNCDGTESNIYFCNLKVWGQHDCTHAEDAGVACNPSGGVDNSTRDGVNPFMDAIKRPIMDAINMTKDYFDEMFDKHMSKFTEMFNGLNRTVMSAISTRVLIKNEGDSLPAVAARLTRVENSSQTIDARLSDIQGTLRNSTDAHTNVHTFTFYFLIIFAIILFLSLVLFCLCRRRLEDAYDYVQFHFGKRANNNNNNLHSTSGSSSNNYAGGSSNSSKLSPPSSSSANNNFPHDRQPIVFQDSIDLEHQELDELSDKQVYESLNNVRGSNSTRNTTPPSTSSQQSSPSSSSTIPSTSAYKSTPRHHTTSTANNNNSNNFGFRQNLFDD